MLDAGALPVPNAFIAIAEAYPKVGTSMLCPSCYPECRLSAVTGADGRATVPKLNPELVYNVLATAPGCEAAVVARAAFDTSLTLRLGALAPTVPAGAILRGRIVDEDGAALAGVRLLPIGKTIPHGLRFGGLEATSPLAVSDREGRFAFRVGDSSAVYLVRTSRAGRGPRVARVGPAGAPPSEIALQQAATIEGRADVQGASAVGLSVLASPCDRNAQTFPGFAEVRADDQGRFVIGDLAPATDYFVYAKSSTLPPDVLLEHVRLVTAAGPAPVDVRLRPVQNGLRVRGHVILDSGGTVEAAGPVGVSSDSLLDLVQLPLPADGRFETQLLPAEPFWLNFKWGYEVVSCSDTSATVMQNRVYLERPPRDPVEVRIRSVAAHGAH